MGIELSQAQVERRERGELLAQQRIDDLADALIARVELSNADRVGPEKRKKLKGLLDHYRKMAKPFTACVRDNTKRFGPERAKKVCAVLTDIEKGTTKWRSGRKKTAMSLSADIEQVDTFAVDEELATLLERIHDLPDYKAVLGLDQNQEA